MQLPARGRLWLGQGYLFSRPVDVAEARRLLHAGAVGSYRRQPDLLRA